LADRELTNCWDSKPEEMKMMFLQEEEEAAEEVAGEATLMLFKEVAGDKMLSRASRRLMRTSQLYEYELDCK